MNNQQKNITAKLQNLVKKRKRAIVVIKAGSIKNVRRSSSSSFEGEYYPTYSEE